MPDTESRDTLIIGSKCKIVHNGTIVVAVIEDIYLYKSMSDWLIVIAYKAQESFNSSSWTHHVVSMPTFIKKLVGGEPNAR